MDLSSPLDIDISDATSLSRAAGWMHDGYCMPADIHYDAAQEVFRLPVWRETGRTSFYRVIIRGLLYQDVPERVMCVLELRDVVEVSMSDFDPDVLMLIDVKYDQSTGWIDIDHVIPEMLRVRVRTLTGTLRDEGEPQWDVPTFGELYRYHLGRPPRER